MALGCRSGPDGRFSFDGLSEDLHASERGLCLSVQKEALLSVAMVVPGDTDVRIVLRRSGAISGRVLLPDGTPAAGARVEVDLQRSADGGKDGSFGFDDISPGVHVVSARAAGDRVLRGERAVEVGDGERLEDVEILLGRDPVSFVSVSVLDPSGRTVEGRAWADAPVIEGGGADLLALAVLPGTPVTISIRTEGLGGVERTCRTTALRSGPPEVVRLPGLLPFRVRVTRPAGAAIPSPVRVRLSELLRDEEFEIREAGPGEVVADLPPGEFVRIEAWADGYGYASRSAVQGEEPVMIEVPLEPYAEVRGRLVPSPGTHTCGLAILDEEDRWGRYLEPDREGWFTFHEVPPGRKLIALQTVRGERPLLCLDVEPGHMHDLGEIRLDALPHIVGRVTGDDGEPLAGATVALENGREVLAAVATRPDGTFDLPYAALPGGHVVVRARGTGLAMLPASASLRSPLDVRLEPEGRLRVRLDPPAAHDFSWTVSLGDGSARWEPRVERTVDEGVVLFVLRGLPEGPLLVGCASGGRTLGEARAAAVSGETRDLVLHIGW